MKLKIKAGTTSKLVKVFIQDSSATDGSGLTGLVYNSASLTAYYIPEGDASATTITLATATVGTYTSGGFIEVDSTNMPGVYELGLPNAVIDATSEGSVLVMLKGATNMAPCLIEIELDAIDYQDGVRAGLAALPNAAPNSANGMLITAAGSLDVDSKLANTNEITAARMGALTDWIDGGRLDLLLDSVLEDTGTTLPATLGSPTAIGLPGTDTIADMIYQVAGGVGFDPSTDGLQAIRNRGDSAWTTSTLSSSEIVTAVAADLADDFTTVNSNITNAETNLTTAISGLQDISSADVQTACAASLVAIHLDHLLAADYDPASKPGTSTALLNELIESDAGVSRFTSNALEQAPSGSGGDASAANQTTIINHLTDIKGSGFLSSTDSLEAISDGGGVQYEYPADANIIRITRNDSYDGTANDALTWTVAKDFTSGWTGTITIKHRLTGASLMSATVTASSAVLLTASLNTTNTAFSALTSDEEFGPHPYDIQMVNGSSTETPLTGVAVIKKDQS